MSVAKVQEARNRAAALGRLLHVRRPQIQFAPSSVMSAHVRSLVFDASLALFVCTFDFAQLLDQSRGGSVGRVLMGALLIASVSTPLLWRRRAPLTVLGVVTVVNLAWFMIPFVAEPPIDHLNAGFLSFLVSLYSAGLYSMNKKASVAAAALALGGVLTAALLLDDEFKSDPRAFLLNTSLVIVFFYVGYIGRVRRDYLEERAARVERERVDETRRVVARERARIARELHDVVAHSVGLMTVQAGAANLVSGDDPKKALSSLSLIEGTGRQALGELRRLLGVLRTDGDEGGELSPQPGLGHLDDLVAEVEAAGVAVEITVEGDLHHMPAALGLSAYRILQEGLTNVVKHAGRRARAQVLVRLTSSEFVLEIEDDGGFAPEPSTVPGGHGLIGMRERVALFGGHMSADPQDEGGFLVKVEIPLEFGER